LSRYKIPRVLYIEIPDMINTTVVTTESAFLVQKEREL